MNNLRKAAEAGAKVLRVFQRDRETGKELAERINPARRAKRELGLSGRQMKKLRKQLAREHQSERPPRLVPPHIPGAI